jgi:hypothetical protein
MPPILVKVPPPQLFSGRAGKGIGNGIVNESLLRENIFPPTRTPLALFQGRDMRFDPRIVTK